VWTSDEVKGLRQSPWQDPKKSLGEMLGVHVVTVIRWESGSFNPSKMAAKMLDRLVSKKQ